MILTENKYGTPGREGTETELIKTCSRYATMA